MIIKEFSKYLQLHNDSILNGNVTPSRLLCDWIRMVIRKNPKNHADKIVHREVLLAENSSGDFFIVGKSDSGRVLVNALYNFALSYENYLLARWLQDKKPHHFKLP